MLFLITDRKKYGVFFKKALILSLGVLLFTSCTIRKKEDKTDKNVLSDTTNLATLALGRRLFFDTRLSGNNRISCATCHQPEKAFSDGLVLSNRGISGKKLKRHVPALIHLTGNQSFFWDGGIANLESLPVAPLTHPDEMGQNLKELCQELSLDTTYKRLFIKAFGSDTVTTQAIVRALASFQRTFKPDSSRYDTFLHNPAIFSSIEKEGMKLFEKHCQTCHKTPIFTDFDFHNNGLDAAFTDSSDIGLKLGRYRITHKAEDVGKYKTPSLRSISRTAPYMHDGRIATLSEVIEHYSHEIKLSPTLDILIPSQGFQFSALEKEQLLAFLKTL
jgi:cytochrome c peroxidase